MCKMDEFASFNLLFFLRFKCCLFCFSVFPAFFSSFFFSSWFAFVFLFVCCFSDLFCSFYSYVFKGSFLFLFSLFDLLFFSFFVHLFCFDAVVVLVCLDCFFLSDVPHIRCVLPSLVTGRTDECDNSFHQIWSCSVINMLFCESFQKSQLLIKHVGVKGCQVAVL